MYKYIDGMTYEQVCLEAVFGNFQKLNMDLA